MANKHKGVTRDNVPTRVHRRNGWLQKKRRISQRRKLKPLKCLSNFLVDYCNRSSLHGLRYISEPGSHWIERLIWALLFTTSVICTIVVISKLSTRFQAAQTSTVVETTNYPVTELPFPSVTLCPSNRVDWQKVLEMEKDIVPAHDMDAVKTYRDLVTTLSTITFGDFDRLHFLENRSLEAFNDTFFKTWKSGIINFRLGIDLDLTYNLGVSLTSLLRSTAPTCSELLRECWWRDSDQDCCKIFEPQRTEYGFCYSFNSETADFDRAAYSKEPRPRRSSSMGDWSGIRFSVRLDKSNQPPETIAVFAPFTLFALKHVSSKVKLVQEVDTLYHWPTSGGLFRTIWQHRKGYSFHRKRTWPTRIHFLVAPTSKFWPFHFDAQSTKGDILRSGPVMISDKALGVTTFVGNPGTWPSSGRNSAIGTFASISVQCQTTYATDRVLQLGKNKLPCRPADGTHYNQNYCLTLCRRNYVINRCGCNPFFMMPSDTGRDCAVADLICLFRENGFFNNYVLKGNPYFLDNNLGMNCSCPVECEVYSYTSQLTSATLRDSIATNTIMVDVHYESANMVRYRMDIVHTQLDLLVSFGGVFGLFLGGSILSAIELLYYLTIGLISQAFRRSKTVREPTEDSEYVKNRNDPKHPVPTVYRVLPLLDYYPNPQTRLYKY